MTLRLIENLHRHAQDRADAAAIVAAGDSAHRSITYGRLANTVEDLAAELKQCLPPGATVMLCYPNLPGYVPAFLAVLAAGYALFPVSSDMTNAELAGAAGRARAAAIIVTADNAPRARELFQQGSTLTHLSENAVLLTAPKWQADVNPGPALLLQSSGTTAEPKIVRRSAESLDRVSRSMVRASGLATDDRVLAAVPLCHSYGLEHGLLAPIWAGSCVHVCRKFDLPVVLDELREGQITMLPGVPFMFDMLRAAAQTPFGSLRRAYSAGGPLPRETFHAFDQKFGVRLGQVYGSTEVGSVTFNDPHDADFDPASVGMPMEGVSVRILDTDDAPINSPHLPSGQGQVAIAAPSMFSGYVNEEPAPLIEGHFLTGDLGVLNAKGALTITARINLLIDVGGRKVNPAEVESVLRQHPLVGQCVVVPMRLSDTVCRLRAILTPSRPHVELSAQELRCFARQRLSGYKVPRVFEIRQTLPTSPAGKVLRRLVEIS
jgi:acyl-CoA synthetase (AMP-forming)/AMP-acid ligase II